jgi:hypothetical protein
MGRGNQGHQTEMAEMRHMIENLLQDIQTL